MSALPIGTRVQLSTGTPRPKRGKWVIQAWLTENGQGTVSEIAPDYYVVRIDTRADGSQVMIQRSQVIHKTDTRFTVTPLEAQPIPDIPTDPDEALAWLASRKREAGR